MRLYLGTKSIEGWIYGGLGWTKTIKIKKNLTGRRSNLTGSLKIFATSGPPEVSAPPDPRLRPCFFFVPQQFYNYLIL